MEDEQHSDNQQQQAHAAPEQRLAAVWIRVVATQMMLSVVLMDVIVVAEDARRGRG